MATTPAGESLNDILLGLPIELSVTRDYLVELGVLADEDGHPSLENYVFATTKALSRLEYKIEQLRSQVS